MVHDCWLSKSLIISMNTAPIKTILYALETRKLGKQGSIKIYKEIHKI